MRLLHMSRFRGHESQDQHVAVEMERKPCGMVQRGDQLEMCMWMLHNKVG